MVANLKTSEQGIAKNKQARNEKGWRVDNPRWLVEASKILEPKKIWQEGGPYADGCSEGNWKRADCVPKSANYPAADRGDIPPWRDPSLLGRAKSTVAG